MSVDPRPWLIDVSEHQGTNIDFLAAKAEGYEGAIVKVTEGVGYVDPQAQTNLIRAGMHMDVVGAYHFLWGGMSPQLQARHFLKQISLAADPTTLLLFVDVEISKHMKKAQYPTFNDVEIFLKTIEQRMPTKRLGIYSGYYWRGDLRNPLVWSLALKNEPLIWDANYFEVGERVDYGSVLYGYVPEGYWAGPAFGGEKADILQFASTGRLGQFPSGIDVNATRPSLSALKSIARGE